MLITPRDLALLFDRLQVLHKLRFVTVWQGPAGGRHAGQTARLVSTNRTIVGAFAAQPVVLGTPRPYAAPAPAAPNARALPLRYTPTLFAREYRRTLDVLTIEAGSPTGVAYSTVPGELGELLGSWRRHLRAQRISPATISTYATAVSHLARFLDCQGMPIVPAGIRREHVEAFITDLLER